MNQMPPRYKRKSNQKLTSQKCGILSSSFLIPGIKTIQEIIRPKRRNNEYTILVEVEFLQVGQALQHKPHAAAPQQQAKFAAQAAAEHAPKTAPMLRLTQTYIDSSKTFVPEFVQSVRKCQLTRTYSKLKHNMVSGNSYMT